MVNPKRLKRLLENIVEKMYPHKPECNLVREVGSYGIGCTCFAREQQDQLREQIEKLEEPDEE